MTATDVGRTRFQDGMRVAREHLDHLQDVLLEAAAQARESVGLGKVCFGFQVQPKGVDGVSIGPGAAFDRQGRLLASDTTAELAPVWGPEQRLHLVARHVLRSGGLVKGVPTLFFDDLAFEARAADPPYDDDAVVFARLDRGEQAVAVTQRGDWYLPPLDHTHSGTFVSRAGRWRYDGHPVSLPPARFDSGFLPLDPGAGALLAHGLGTTDLLVQLQARRGGVIGVAGLGSAYWYELPDEGHVRLVRAEGEPGELALRVSAWPLDPSAGGPLLPLADPGSDMLVEPGESFALDGSRSRAFGGRRLVKYRWMRQT